MHSTLSVPGTETPPSPAEIRALRDGGCLGVVQLGNRRGLCVGRGSAPRAARGECAFLFFLFFLSQTHPHRRIRDGFQPAQLKDPRFNDGYVCDGRVGRTGGLGGGRGGEEEAGREQEGASSHWGRAFFRAQTPSLPF